MVSDTRTQSFIPIIFALLVACGPSEQTYRDTSAPIAAISRFEADLFSGDWIISESIQHRSPARVNFEYKANDAQFVVSGPGVADIAGVYREGVPGELVPLSAGRETLVVMWVDEDFQTAVVGAPSGRFAMVLDRNGQVPPDRAQVVRDILDFYGWDVSALQANPALPNSL